MRIVGLQGTTAISDAAVVDDDEESNEACDESLFEGIAKTAAVSAGEPASLMVDLAEVLTPEQLAQIDPRVIAFYKNPTAFELRGGVDLTPAGKHLLPLIAQVADQGHIDDQKPGFEDYPMRQTLVRDAGGHVHWHRMVQENGKWKTLFDARFERDGDYVKETFKRGPIDVPLVFRVAPYEGGIKLELVHSRSSPLALGQDITFTTVPTADGLLTTGHLSSELIGPMGDLKIKISERSA